MFHEGGSRIERYVDPTAGVSERQIADFVREREPDPRLTAGFDFEISRGTFRHNFPDLLPYFEEECSRTGAPDLLETRRMTHYLDKRTGVQSDFPETGIIAVLNRLEGEYVAEAMSNRQPDEEAAEIREAWDEDIGDYSDHRDLEPALRRIEAAVAKLDREIELISSRKKQSLAETQEAKRKIDEKKEKLTTLRAVRSTLLEQYLSMR